jgi:hypothetical protein
MRRNLGICEQPKDRLGLPKIERNQTFLRRQHYSNRKIAYGSRALAFAIAPMRALDLSREQTSLWFAGYPNAAVLRRRELGRLIRAKRT